MHMPPNAAAVGMYLFNSFFKDWVVSLWPYAKSFPVEIDLDALEYLSPKFEEIYWGSRMVLILATGMAQILYGQFDLIFKMSFFRIKIWAEDCRPQCNKKATHKWLRVHDWREVGFMKVRKNWQRQ